MEITDSYAHCGLRKYRPLEDVKRMMKQHGVARTVLVEHIGEFDNSYIEGIVAREPKRFAGVFLVDLKGKSPIDDVTRWTKAGHFRGIRMPVESLETEAPLWRWCGQLGLNFVLYGSFSEPNARRLARFASEYPKIHLVIAHLGFPDMKEAPGFASLRPVLSLGERENVLVQISGMHSRGSPPYSELLPVIGMLYQAYGKSRLLYGSNYPAMPDLSLYGTEIELLTSGRLGIPQEALPAVMNANALRVWFGPRRLRAG